METINLINKALNRTGLDKVQSSKSIVDKALSFNVRDLDTVDDRDITKMIVGLSQYLIYITLEINKFRIQKIVLERDIEVDVATFVAATGIKGTKVEKRLYAAGASTELAEKEEKLQELTVEYTLLDNLDKYLEFYINAMKKESARREIEHNFKVR